MKHSKSWIWGIVALVSVFVVAGACCFGAWLGGLAGMSFATQRAARVPQVVPPERQDWLPYEEPFPEMEPPEIYPPTIPESPEEEGVRPWLGVELRQEMDGARILGVMPESPAAEAGLEVGDLITHVAGRPVNERPLSAMLLEYVPGDLIDLTVLRSGEEYEVTVELGARYQETLPPWEDERIP